MCEYCGCQDVPAIAILTAEHDEIRAVAREAAHAAKGHDRVAAGEAATRLLALLGPHTEIEERFLFPAVAGEFADHVASIEDDHRRIDDALRRLADVGDDDGNRVERADAALAVLFSHILREQDGLFPAALSVLTPEQWAVLDEVRTNLTAHATAAALM